MPKILRTLSPDFDSLPQSQRIIADSNYTPFRINPRPAPPNRRSCPPTSKLRTSKPYTRPTQPRTAPSAATHTARRSADAELLSYPEEFQPRSPQNTSSPGTSPEPQQPLPTHPPTPLMATNGSVVPDRSPDSHSPLSGQHPLPRDSLLFSPDPPSPPRQRSPSPRASPPSYVGRRERRQQPPSPPPSRAGSTRKNQDQYIINDLLVQARRARARILDAEEENDRLRRENKRVRDIMVGQADIIEKLRDQLEEARAQLPTGTEDDPIVL